MALGAYEKALEIDPNDSSALTHKGYALNMLGRYGEALPVFEKSIDIDQTDAVTFRGQGDKSF